MSHTNRIKQPQPPIGMETIVVELNQSSADKVEQNGIYHVVLPTPVLITPGSQLSVRMATINSPERDQETVVIDQTETVAISYSYWDVDYDKTDKTVLDKSVAWPDPTYDYFAAYNVADLQTITSVIVKINGFVPPNAGFGNPGGTYVVGSKIEPPPWTKIDTVISCILVFSYIEENGKLGLLYCSVDNVQEYPISAPTGPKILYGASSGTQMTQRYGITLSDGELYCTPVSADQSKTAQFPVIRKGSLNLVGVQGGTPGGIQSADKKNTYTFPSNLNGDGAVIIGSPDEETNAFDRDNKSNPHDPYRINQFSIVAVNGTTATGSNQLYVRNTAIKLDSGRYDNKALAVKLTQALSDSQGLLPALSATTNQLFSPNNPMITLTDDPENTDLLFRRVDLCFNDIGVSGLIQFDNSNSYRYYDIPTAKAPSYIVGAQQFALEYGNAGSAFQLSFAHTPLQEDGKPNEQLVGIYETGTGIPADPYRYYEVKAATGIVIHDLQPRSLWADQMGIADQLIVPLRTDASGVQYYERDQFLNKITYGFLGLDAFPIPPAGGNWRKQVQPLNTNPTYYDCTGNSRAIIGETNNRDSDGEVFYIELVNALRRQGGYIDEFQDRHQIAAIVSAAYLTNDVITAFSDSGIPYVHKGTPYMISDIWVRILSKATKEPIEGLGGLNTVFLQVDRPIEAPTQQ